jgi:hypothetical protein
MLMRVKTNEANVVLGRHGEAILSLLGYKIDKLARHPNLMRVMLELTTGRPVLDEELLDEAATRFQSDPILREVISEMAGVVLNYRRANAVPLPSAVDDRFLAAYLLAIRVRDYCHEEGLLKFSTKGQYKRRYA